MQWKKKSCGWMPVIKRPSIKPPDLGEVSKDVKLGRDLPDIIKGGRFPSNSICPSRQEICMVFTMDPLAPDRTINCRLFDGNLVIRPLGRQVLEKEKMLIWPVDRFWMNSPINVICVAIQEWFVFTIQKHSELRILYICRFHFLNQLIVRRLIFQF